MDVAAQFFTAAVSLSLSTESLQDRLANAYADHLLAVTGDDLPPDLRQPFAALESALNREDIDAEDDDPFLAAARLLTDDEASQLIERVLLLYGRLTANR
jgi:hypothetical protein